MASAVLDRVGSRYTAQAAAVRARVLAFVERAWARMPDHRDADLERFVATVVPIVTGGQRQIAALTDAYLSQVESETFGATVRPLGIPPELVTDAAMRGIAAAEVYLRAGVTVWTALSTGAELAAAVRKGGERAVAIAAVDLQLAKTHAARHVFEQRERVVGFRRVLEGPESCALCIIASTQRYRKGDLMPIHAHCDCGVEPIFGTRDPGRVIDRVRLEDVHQAVARRLGDGAVRRDARSATDYRDLLVVHQHGEIGPVLAVRTQAFTGPDDL